MSELRRSQHPLSAAFPPMAADDFLSLKDSIENIGVQNPITLLDGMVIDGWHRYTACGELGMSCPEVELADVDPVDFVRAQNKERRHLSPGAWALIEVQLWDWMPSHRQAEKKGEPGSPFLDTPATSRPTRSNADMAQAAGVTDRTIQHAKKVEQDAVPLIKDAVKSGDVSVKVAAQLSRLPKEEQQALADQGIAAMKQAAKTAAQPPKPAMQETEPAEPTFNAEEDVDVAKDMQRLIDDNESMGRVFDADDRLAEAMKEIARYREENRVLRSRVNGLVNEKDAAIKQAKEYKRKLDRLERAKGAA